MERLTLACGGMAVNSTEDISEEMLGWAGQVRNGKRKLEHLEYILSTSPCRTKKIVIRWY